MGRFRKSSLLLGAGIVLVAAAVFVLGGVDDSPGLQLIGLIIAAWGLKVALKRKVR